VVSGGGPFIAAILLDTRQKCTNRLPRLIAATPSSNPPGRVFAVRNAEPAEGFHLTLGQNSAEAIHLMVEKNAYADRNRVAGDPRFVDWPLTSSLPRHTPRAP
jgi:gamma-glutamyltranspeptidase